MRALATAVLVVAAAAAPALAQRPPANRPPQEVATELVKQAISKSQVGDHLGAIDLYLNAYSLIPQHTLLSNVGAEFQAAGKPIEALKYFCMYLDKDPTGTLATYATSKAKALQIELGNKSVDDRTVCKPLKGDRKPPPPRPDDDDDDDAVTTVDDTTGTAELRTDRDRDRDKPTPGRPGGGLRYAGIGTAAAGVVALGLGGYFGIQAKKKSDWLSEHDRNDKWPDELKQVEADGQRYEDRQIQFSVAGGALVVAGVVLYVIGATRPDPAPEKLSVTPIATPDGGVGFAVGRGF